MKNRAVRAAGLTIQEAGIGVPMIAPMIANAAYHNYVHHTMTLTGHYVLLLFITFWQNWFSPIIWITLTELLVLLVLSPFFIWRELRPAATKAWAAGVLALLGARFILFYISFP